MEARIFPTALLAAVVFTSAAAQHRTRNFLVNAPSEQLAQECAVAAEKFRHDLAVEWLGQAMPNWSYPCIMTVSVGPSMGAGGATKFVFDHGEVYGWNMTVQGSHERLLDSVLPHEVLHTILASHFRQRVPRWADEGAASSVEHESERKKHYDALQQFLRTGRGIAFDRMFAMEEYPRDMMPLYAQGYSLVRFLIEQGGKRKFIEFLGEGIETEQWSAALQRHYGTADMRSLQQNWLAWVRRGSPSLPSRTTQPAGQSKQRMLAANQRLPRPEPDLIYHVRGEQLASYAPGSVIPDRLSAQTRPVVPLPTQPTASARPQPTSSARQMPSSGWYAAGSVPEHPPAKATVPAASAAPVATPYAPSRTRSQVAHPQPWQRPRQIILAPCSTGST